MDARIFTLHVLTLCCLIHGSLQGLHQRRLYKELMRNYNPLERPVNNDSHSLTVHFSFSLLQIMDVDEKNQVLTTNIWLQLMKNSFIQFKVLNSVICPRSCTVRGSTGRASVRALILYNLGTPNTCSHDV